MSTWCTNFKFRLKRWVAHYREGTLWGGALPQVFSKLFFVTSYDRPKEYNTWA